jgi:ferredoxin
MRVIWRRLAGCARRRPAASAPRSPRSADLRLAIDHLRPGTARGRRDALPALALLGRSVDTERCTLCLACVGACPEHALADNPDRPQLKFIEKNCVQCGLCASTCPERAITLQPRLLLADEGRARKATRVLNEAQPFACVRCGKPFGTARAIENMLVSWLGTLPSMRRGRAPEDVRRPPRDRPAHHPNEVASRIFGPPPLPVAAPEAAQRTGKAGSAHAA